MTILSFLKQKRSLRAFTLIETLVSTMIVSVVILGPLTVAMNASAYAKQTKDTMTASYLAQEAIELLRHQQDSIYLRCTSGANLNCQLQGGEIPRETAWRIFRDRLGSNAQGVSCYNEDNTFGCSYDFIDMLTDEDQNPPKYASNSSSCSSLSITSAGLYVCRGVHGAAIDKQTSFSRTVSVTSIPTFPGGDAAYNDDLRITVTITWRRVNGYSKQIKVVDFLHARA